MSHSVIPLAAAALMQATESTVGEVSQQVLAHLGEHLDIDAAFLRHNDHQVRVSRLVAAWPPSRDKSGPDLLAVVHFGSSDPILELGEHGTKPLVIRPDPAKAYHEDWIDDGRNRWAAEARHTMASSVAAAPLISEGATTGVLAFVKFRRKRWKADEIDTLEVVAALFAQLQARLAAEEQLRFLADHDDLTGLHNRRALIAHLSDRLAAGQPGPVAVFYFDLDRLKTVNDYLGHGAGDSYIRMFAEKLRETAGSNNMIARIGGDEFVVVPDEAMSIDAAQMLGDRLRAALHDRLSLGGYMVTRTVSIGVAIGVPGRDNRSDLLHRADEAVLSAKRKGGNHVAVASGDMSLRRLFHNDIEVHLHGDIESDAFLLHYLPEVDLWTGAIVGAEALVRWRDPRWGWLLPDSFIALAETTNSLEQLVSCVISSFTFVAECATMRHDVVYWAGADR